VQANLRQVGYSKEIWCAQRDCPRTICLRLEDGRTGNCPPDRLSKTRSAGGYARFRRRSYL